MARFFYWGKVIDKPAKQRYQEYMDYNVYCDESCHLEHDPWNIMVLGCVWLPAREVKKVSNRLRDLKLRYDYKWETKWTRVSPGALEMYQAILDYFWDEPNLKFRAVVVNDKKELDHKRFNAGSADAFYYKMFYQAIKHIIDPRETYRVYIDKKDTWSAVRTENLRDILRTKFQDYRGESIARIQQVRSHESQLVQLCDLLIGALSYHNRGLKESPAKQQLVQQLSERALQDLGMRSSFGARKFNIFFFDPQKN